MTDHFTGRIARVKDATATDAIPAPGVPTSCDNRTSGISERDAFLDRQLLLGEMLQRAKRDAYLYKAHVDGLDRGMVGDQVGVEIALETFRVWQAMVSSMCPLEAS